MARQMVINAAIEREIIKPKMVDITFQERTIKKYQQIKITKTDLLGVLILKYVIEIKQQDILI